MRPVLIIEDHPLVAEATGELLLRQESGLAVSVSSNLADALHKIDGDASSWDRIFVDLDVPGAVGLSLASEIRQRNLAARSCVLSASHLPEFVEAVAEWGFLGYLDKAAPLQELEAGLRSVLHGHRTFSGPPTRSDIAPIRLTRRQTELLELVRAGMSSKQIARRLNIAKGTVNNHVSAILHAMRAGSRAQAVGRAIEFGLLASQPGGRLGRARRPNLETRGRRS